ncbi:MobQ family relaxase [Rhizobium metallidurans]|uniref:MobA/MobL protein domain-containing protein n=1 Tax=Rhizobium metallidurans TaxID=1265931 RepID=A0A7W6CYF4_9HYPH|nr:MobQ family relaxase [Rhizobium metallidurans]MBB3967162.1 hypothetical protein [Rhizobium metallidurans]
MAIYHFSAQILGRNAKRNPDGTRRPGSSAVAAAAYRAGERLIDRNAGQSHDYSRRGGVVHSEIMAPPGSAPWLEDREILWNTVEAMETRKDAQLAREFNMALPFELTHDQRLDLVRDFVGAHFVKRGMVADIALHDPIPDQGQNAKNFHAHVMLTLRRATPDGLDPVKTREWNSKELLNAWRAEWAVACNAALERAGKRNRVDHRTLASQLEEAMARKDRAEVLVLNREPEIHVGPRARKAVQQGRPPQSRERQVGADRRPAGRPTAKPRRRTRDYPAYDKGTRLNWLEKILVGNDERLKRDLLDMNRRFDRLSRKLDHWERRTSFKTEGLIMGKQFRFNRWKAADEEKQRKALAEKKAVHARKRLAQIRALLKGLEMALALGNRRRETGLVRAREVAGWLRPSRSVSRSRGNGRQR